MSRAARIIGGTLLTTACAFFAYFVYANFPGELLARLTLGQLRYLVYAVALYCIGFVTSSVCWYFILTMLGARPVLLRVFAVYLVSQFAKYLPGNVGQFASRIALANETNAGAAQAGISLVVESGWVVVTAVVIAVFTLLGAGQAYVEKLGAFGVSGPMLALVATIGLLAPLVVVWASVRFRLAGLSAAAGGQAVPGLKAALFCFPAYGVNFILYGLIINLMASGVLDATESQIWLLTGIMAVAWVAGYVTPGAPAGLGVREAILGAALAPLYGADGAIVLTVMLRIIASIGDLCGFLFGLALRWLLLPIAGGGDTGLSTVGDDGGLELNV